MSSRHSMKTAAPRSVPLSCAAFAPGEVFALHDRDVGSTSKSVVLSDAKLVHRSAALHCLTEQQIATFAATAGLDLEHSAVHARER